MEPVYKDRLEVGVQQGEKFQEEKSQFKSQKRISLMCLRSIKVNRATALIGMS